MKIIICGSMSLSKEMVEIGGLLKAAGNEVVLPKHTEEYAEERMTEESQEESAQNKIQDDLIRDYYEKIKSSDAVLVVNKDKNGVRDYIGGNSFLEMGFAHVLGKKVYILNNVPEVSYKSEIIAMQPIILEGDLKKIQTNEY